MDIEKDQTIYIGYGIGCYYASVSHLIKSKVKLSFLCDKKWGRDITIYDDIPVISLDDIPRIVNAKVIIFPNDQVVKQSIAKEFDKKGIAYIFASSLLANRSLTAEDIKREGQNGIWRDEVNNIIYYDDSLPERIKVYFGGEGNVLRVNANVIVDDLNICFGNYGSCEIGENTRIIGSSFIIAYASVIIGKDCLFSSGITLRTHDGHHIFDRITGERLNVCKDIVIDNHVWIGREVLLLSGAQIGEGSVVGARTITSSQFGDHVIVAGVPGKVIRRDVCWSKDATAVMNYSCLEECISGDALKYRE